MFSKLFKKSPTPKEAIEDGVIVIAQLNARVQPMDRGEYFEDPLDDILQSRKLGEVTGGGTQLTEEPDGIEYCDIEITLDDDGAAAIQIVLETLEHLGAPKGSLLKFTDDRADIPFGKLEGLGLFLNGTDLPQEVYQNSDVNDVIEKCDAALKGIGSFRGYWQGSQETALYFYGTGYETMKNALTPILSNEPLCKKSRITQIA